MYNWMYILEIEEMRRKMQEEIREQLLANQQMMDDNTGWDAKLSQVNPAILTNILKVIVTSITIW